MLRSLITVPNLAGAACIDGYLPVSVMQGQIFYAGIAFMSAGQVHKSEMSKSRHAPGSWYERILRAVSAHSSTTALAQIYDWMPTHGHLRPRALVLSANDRPRYHHIVRGYCRELCEMRELDRVGRGIYRVTTVELSDALVLHLPDEPGALATVAGNLKDAGVNIESVHILSRQSGHAIIALKTDNRAEAIDAIGTEIIV